MSHVRYRFVDARWDIGDPDLGRRSVTDLQFDRLVRNVYKVLLTRGMIGTVLYATDPRTQAFLAGLIEGAVRRVTGAPAHD